MDFAKVLAQVNRFPSVVIDLEAFDRNTVKVAQQCQGSQTLRVATKSVRVPFLLKRILDFGLPYRGLMTFSAFETRDLAQDGFDDFLLAYPLATHGEAEAIRQVVDKKKKVRVVVDSAEHLEILAPVFGDSSIEVVLDIDLSLRPLGGKIHLGVRRSPLRSPEDVWGMYQKLSLYPMIRFGGLMGYEAQVAGLGDRNPFSTALNPIKQMIRKASANRCARLRKSIFELFEQKKVSIPLYNGGGSGSLNWTHDEACLTEMAAGSAWFSPHLFDYYSNIKFEPSCFFALSIVRRSDPLHSTLQGGGYIASGEPGWDRLPVLHWPKGLKWVSAEGCGEVQSPVYGRRLPIGRHVVLRHAKAGELMERFNEVFLVQENHVVNAVPTYRGLGRAYF